MPLVYAESIEDVRLGTQMVGALMAGTNELYVRWTKHFYETPGEMTFTLPNWATAYGVILCGGGGGGYSGNGGNGNNGHGGRGGGILGVAGTSPEPGNRVLNITIGAGGAGGTGINGDRYGKNGGTTSIKTLDSQTFHAPGGTANPTTDSQAGGTQSYTFKEPFPTYFNLPPGSVYKNGPGGTGNAGSGKRGGGGAGGNGGYLGNYTHGGKGGNGFVEIYVWGLPRHDTSPNPPIRETVQITLGSDLEARDQLRAALANRGLDHTTVREIPFDIALFGEGSARDMFRVCAALTWVPDMDTSGVTNMRSMFNGCTSLITVPAMDTSQVTDMQYMFQDCSSLTTVASMDTSNVTNMNSMFRACTALTYVPDMQTSNVTDMSYMFQDCSSLTDGNVRLIGRHPQLNSMSMTAASGLTREPFYDDKEVVQITGRAAGESRDQLRAALTERGLDYQTVTELPFDLDTSLTASFQEMFRDMAALTTVPPMDTGQAFTTYQMFRGCKSLTHIGDLRTTNVIAAGGMFFECEALMDGAVRLIGKNPNVTTLNMITSSGLTREPFDTTIEVVPITLGSGFAARDQFRAALTARGLNYQTVKEIPFDISLSGSGDAIQMFFGCHALTSIPPLNMGNVTNTNGFFQECASLVTIPPMDTRNVWNAPSMFAYCRSLTSVPTMDTSKMTNVSHMFQTCASLTSVPAMDTSAAKDMASMFRACSSLTSVPDLVASSATTVDYMFNGCIALTDGNVRLIGKNPNVTTLNMITGSGLTREPWVI